MSLLVLCNNIQRRPMMHQAGPVPPRGACKPRQPDHATELQGRRTGCRCARRRRARVRGAKHGRFAARLRCDGRLAGERREHPYRRLLFSQRERVVKLALEDKFAVVYPEAEFAQAGGLLSYGPSPVRPVPARRLLRRQDLKAASRLNCQSSSRTGSSSSSISRRRERSG